MENLKKEIYSAPTLLKHESLRDLTARGSYVCSEEEKPTINLWYRWQ